ncbi:hypothetical protein K227x_38630 [Rubripirellula lacrimiformis]|uniref:Uncharacterized protein n=1 Tax=Rubripirellula lacrimiformis TaxID=1930273 RepID=A0A517NEA4_9BACT|nr:hypothetical protein [Rubripirellula lacrimiformis]QDT05463.1 hypothetical protein K227x_38630 [Rubripirellula lacrimiformis]
MSIFFVLASSDAATCEDASERAPEFLAAEHTQEGWVVPLPAAE